MRALIVVSHPNPQSLTHAVAQRTADAFRSGGEKHTVEIADLEAEGFDPRFTSDDHAVHLKGNKAPPDVEIEQQRIERADTLIIVYPVYWWSMPAILKGWIDRVFTRGWAYEDGPKGVIGKLNHLPVHTLALGGASQSTYERHGYVSAMKTQIDHGIFGYCGAPVVTSKLLLKADNDFQKYALDVADDVGCKATFGRCRSES